MIPELMILLFVVGVALIVAIAVFAHKMEKKRLAGLAEQARNVGLTFSPQQDRALPERFGFINKLKAGSNRYACAVSRGTLEGYPVTVFDYHFETHSTDSKGRSSTHHHWHHLFTMELKRGFPELLISPENLFTRFAQALGYPAITFESHEFSKTYLVRGKDKRFAYDVCHPRMMQWLLERQPLTIEIEHTIVAFLHNGKQRPETFSDGLQRLIDFRRLLPDYLFEPR